MPVVLLLRNSEEWSMKRVCRHVLCRGERCMEQAVKVSCFLTSQFLLAFIYRYCNTGGNAHCDLEHLMKHK